MTRQMFRALKSQTITAAYTLIFGYSDSAQVIADGVRRVPAGESDERGNKGNE